MKAIESYFPVVLFIMLYKVALCFESVDEIHSNESYWAVFLNSSLCFLARFFKQYSLSSDIPFLRVNQYKLKLKSYLRKVLASFKGYQNSKRQNHPSMRHSSSSDIYLVYLVPFPDFNSNLSRDLQEKNGIEKFFNDNIFTAALRRKTNERNLPIPVEGQFQGRMTVFEFKKN